ncbi:MAG: hypothetical protein ACRDQ7_27130 [Haloechinothrix sp.]
MLTTLDNVCPVGLPVLDEGDAITLLTRLDPAGRLTEAPVSAAELARMCGHLP